MNTMFETQLEFDFMKEDQLHFDWSDQKIYFSTGNTSLLTITPSLVVVFTSGSVQVGKLDWNDGVMKFEGDANESAQLFFDNIIKRYEQLPLSNETGWKS